MSKVAAKNRRRRIFGDDLAPNVSRYQVFLLKEKFSGMGGRKRLIQE
ncbi:hypothetical protein O9992_20660 [Vibrio lentus]|nr:hypothetical protein [Vibrio lentus]